MTSGMLTPRPQPEMRSAQHYTLRPQNRDQPEVRLCVGIFEVDVLAHVASRMPSFPGSFYRRLFSYIGPYKYKTSAQRQPS